MVRAPEFEDGALVARCIAWLASEHFDRRLEGGGSLRDAPVENGIRNSLCGGDEYEAEWNGRRHFVDWHLKVINGADAARFLVRYATLIADPRRLLI